MIVNTAPPNTRMLFRRCAILQVCLSYFIVRASCNQFDAEKTNVQSALKILQVICTNLKELFPTPSTGPSSPISVRTVGITL